MTAIWDFAEEKLFAKLDFVFRLWKKNRVYLCKIV